ncbi:unnamed protein product [Owenia fusiformis]|uniref:Uncharacterized protein n=1 Tax=Owenia fusiformis TaxID=6347 RepID=A0A8S4PDC9_OWEFU|nr:unnamed protein product [Owenia fusiformis]
MLDTTSISTLTFLRFTPNLKVLSIEHCNNLVSDDIASLKYCKNVEQIHMSHTGITARSIFELCAKCRFGELIVLDCQGIEFIFSETLALTTIQKDLIYFGLSLFPTFTRETFEVFFRKRLPDIDWRLF